MVAQIPRVMLAFAAFFACLHTVLAASNSSASGDDVWVTYQNAAGQTVYLRDDRRPSLYTGNYGDCLGNSLINVTRFDAAYYRDNMTVLFHLEGNSGIANESLMMYIGVSAYGSSRFDLTFNPCAANINSLCPLNSSVPIEAQGIIPIAGSDVSDIPSIAYSIPDFEGQAILRIFANSTQSQIGCYVAVVTNGGTFSHPAAVGTTLGVFALLALLASFATAIFGEAVTTMRLHYAHSLSVGVVFAVYQHIFFTGALSVNWPSVLPAWWSNFAWAGGMIYSSSMQASINHLIGRNIGNTSEVGAAPSGSTQNDLGGGYDISQIYKRAFSSDSYTPLNRVAERDMISEIYRHDFTNVLRRDLLSRHVERSIARRALADASDGYSWYGHPVGPGLPSPGNFSGFAGTLADEDIPASNAFMTGFLWFLILLVLVTAAVVAFKWTLEALAKIRLIAQDRLKFFRDHWLQYTAAVALRTCFIAWFMIMFLVIFQFTYQSSGGVKAVAAIIFIIFIVGIPGAAAYAYYYKLNGPHSECHTGSPMERKKLLGVIPWHIAKRNQSSGDTEVAQDSVEKTKPVWKRMASVGSFTNGEGGINNIHDDEDYTMKFGWLTSRFRRTRWWFFTFWIFYEFLRAIFYGGASGFPLAQVFGLLVVEVLAFAFVVWARPFEGQRLNILVIYFLGFSKVASVALSIAFDVRFNLDRITTTVIGIVIIVIQGILTILTWIAVVIGLISTYMSVSRNREDFRPRKWAGWREKYFDHLDRAVDDLPREPKPKPAPPKPEEPKEPYFEMKTAKRVAKIEDEDSPYGAQALDPSNVNFGERMISPHASDPALTGPTSGAVTPVGRGRTGSVRSLASSSLPYGARAHRQSWSMRDSTTAGNDGMDKPHLPIDMSRHISDDGVVGDAVGRSRSRAHSRSQNRTPSRGNTLPTQKVKPVSSAQSLRVGGEASTRDTIGDVPTPIVRPRSNTFGSRGGSRHATPTNSMGPSDFENIADTQYSQRGPKVPLTPAQELEEWGTPLQQSRSRM